MNCPYCKEKDLENDSNYCTSCGEDLKYRTIGGWLILVGIGIWLSPFIMLFQVFQAYSGLFKNGVWEALTTKGSQYYIEYYGTTLIIETLINSLFVLFSFYLIYLFSSKKIKFKKYYTVLAILTPLFIYVDALVVKELFSEELFDKDAMRDFIKSLIGLCIWVPYLWTSKRSEKTFIN